MKTDWCDAAQIRSRQIGSGKDVTFSRLFLPYYKRLFAGLDTRSVLEVGCGTGHLATELSSTAGSYTAIDSSPSMISEARAVCRNAPVCLGCTSLENHDCSQTYAIVLVHMCMQTIVDISTFMAAALQRLIHGGSFIFSIPHPCFYNEYKQCIPTEQYSYFHAASATIDLRISLDPNTTIANIPYHHRPLTVYFKALHCSGFNDIHLQELMPSKEIQRHYPMPRAVPHYIVFAARRSAEQGDEMDALTRAIYL